MLDPRIEAHRVGKKLWVGSYPDHYVVREHFNTLVLCAVELQFVEFDPHDLHVVYAPLDDAKPTAHEIHTAISAAKTVHAMRQRGKRVLVTCAQGINRSALVAAMALMLEGHSAKVAIHMIREQRKPPIGLTPLFNEHFQALLHHLDRHRHFSKHTPASAI